MIHLKTLIESGKIAIGQWACYYPCGQVTIQSKPSMNTEVFSICYDFIHSEKDFDEKLKKCFKKYVEISNRFRPRSVNDFLVVADRAVIN